MREELDSADDADILDVGNERRRFEWRPLSPREVIVLVLVAVLGLGVSGGVTLWLDARERERALANEAQLLGYLTPHDESSSGDENLCTRLDLRLINAGHRPVKIESIGIDVARLELEPKCGTPTNDPALAVAPSHATTWTVPVRIACEKMSGSQEIRATVRTQSGATHTVSIPAGRYMYELAHCDQPYVDWTATKAERITSYDKPALRLTGLLTVDIRWLELKTARTIGFGAAVQVLGSTLPKRIGPKAAQGQLDIAVDCEAIPGLEDANFDVELVTNISVQTTIQPDSGSPRIAAAFVRLIDDTCGDTL